MYKNESFQCVDDRLQYVYHLCEENVRRSLSYTLIAQSCTIFVWTIDAGVLLLLYLRRQTNVNTEDLIVLKWKKCNSDDVLNNTDDLILKIEAGN